MSLRWSIVSGVAVLFFTTRSDVFLHLTPFFLVAGFMVKMLDTSTQPRYWNVFYRHQLLQLASEQPPAVDLSAPNTQRLLAWLVRHFVPLVVEDSKEAWLAMMANTPIEEYVTPSDLAFVVLVLEHHIMKWRQLALFKLETGKLMSEEASRGVPGLLYPDGIAGKDAKRRFDALSLYFYMNFYRSPACPGQVDNMSRLQDLVNKMAKDDAVTLTDHVNGWNGTEALKVPSLTDIQNDVLHRVFYYMQV